MSVFRGCHLMNWGKKWRKSRASSRRVLILGALNCETVPGHKFQTIIMNCMPNLSGSPTHGECELFFRDKKTRNTWQILISFPRTSLLPSRKQSRLRFHNYCKIRFRRFLSRARATFSQAVFKSNGWTMTRYLFEIETPFQSLSPLIFLLTLHWKDAEMGADALLILIWIPCSLRYAYFDAQSMRSGSDVILT